MELSISAVIHYISCCHCERRT